VNRFTLTVDGDRIQPIVAEYAPREIGADDGPLRITVALGEVTLVLDEDAAEDLADAIVDAIVSRAAVTDPWPVRRRRR
jgi:hypothetical protein